MSIRFPKVRTKDFRPPGAAAKPPVGREFKPQPRAVACPHRPNLDGLSDRAILGIISDAEKRNLRDQRDHETRWLSQRSSVARAMRRERKAAGKWNP